jgi:tRNA threonylcarbamoyladenosine biosynthesis protein TsaB
MSQIDMDKKELITLAIDASGQYCSAAITKGWTLAGEQVISGTKNHSELILLIIDELVNSTGIALSDIDIVAVTKGPGSFTGVRTGISTAQGLAFSLDKILVGVSTLEVLAVQSGIDSGYVCPMIDARKKQVYTCLYKFSGSNVMNKEMGDTVISPEKWLTDLPAQASFIGDGAGTYSSNIEGITDRDYRVLPEFMGIIRAGSVAFSSLRSYLNYQRNDLESIVPEYIRSPDAVVGKKRKNLLNRP